MNRIKQLREERGWNQDYLGDLLNVKRATVSKYETEKIPLTKDTILQLSTIFQVSSDYLLGISQELNPINDIAFTPSLSTDQQELFALYKSLSPMSQGRALERLRTLSELEVRDEKNKNLK